MKNQPITEAIFLVITVLSITTGIVLNFEWHNGYDTATLGATDTHVGGVAEVTDPAVLSTTTPVTKFISSGWESCPNIVYANYTEAVASTTVELRCAFPEINSKAVIGADIYPPNSLWKVESVFASTTAPDSTGNTTLVEVTLTPTFGGVRMLTQDVVDSLIISFYK